MFHWILFWQMIWRSFSGKKIQLLNNFYQSISYLRPFLYNFLLFKLLLANNETYNWCTTVNYCTIYVWKTFIYCRMSTNCVSYLIFSCQFQRILGSRKQYFYGKYFNKNSYAYMYENFLISIVIFCDLGKLKELKINKK